VCERALTKRPWSSLRLVELQGKRLLLSGATGGLGRAIAEELAAHGARLVLSARRAEELERLARSLPGGEERHRVAVADLAEEGAAERAVREAGELDGLIANAALPGVGAVEKVSAEELSMTLRVNLEAPMLMARALAPELIEKGEGHIVFISSLNGKVGTPRTAIYCATKFGMRGFALALREDLHPKGVGVSTVLPGFIREAGMFHDAGVKSPPGLGTTSPKKVGKAVVTAITRNRSEVEPATLRLRLASGIAHRHPELAARIQRRGGAEKIAESLVEGHAGKR
jgi:short-subunit dehydrogenase